MAFFEFPHTRTYDSDLGWLIKQMNSVTEAIEYLNTLEPRVKALEACCAALESGDLPPGLQYGLVTWLRNNAPEIIKEMIKNVWFGLTDTGYFVAYIPDSWQDIIFKTTGLDIELALQPEYGHLVLQYQY